MARIRVKAVPGALHQRRDEHGRLIPNRFVGLDGTLEIIEDGVEIEATPDIRRAIIRGELEQLPGDA